MFFISVFCIVVAYGIGSLNTAILVCRAMHLQDPRASGSGNPGATNVLRSSGKKAAAIVLAGDVLKGFVPVLLAGVLGVSGFWFALVALASVVGHVFPIFFKFRGGKGIATALGTLLAISAGTAFLVLIVWCVVVFLTKYISLASLIASALSVVLILLAHTGYFIPFLLMVILIFWKHRENIMRLKAGNEYKISAGIDFMRR